MHAIVLVLIFIALTGDYLVMEGWAPGPLPYLQDIIAAVAAAVVVVAGAAERFRYVHSAYWFAFGGLLLVMICGVIVNTVEPGPVFAGVRTHLRAIPLFFLPAVFAFRSGQYRAQLLLILAIALLQLPIALDQRMTTFREEYFSGDRTVGTLMISGELSIFLICVACALTGFYLRKRIRGWTFLVLFLIVLAPTMLNETKATLVLLPLGLLTTFIAGSAPGRRLRNGLLATLLLAMFGAIFIPVYDYFMKPRWGYGIVEFTTMEGRVEGYMDKDAKLGSKQAGRLDALVVPLTEIARDPSTLAFGYGIGNASDSALGLQYTGHYYRRFEPFLMSAASTYLLETGVLGFALILLLCLLVFRDTRIVARDDEGLPGALAVGWLGVTVTMVVAAFYKDAMVHGPLTFLFWFFSGAMAAQRLRMAIGTQPARASGVLMARRANAAR